MRILVTGATGFVGSQLCRALVRAGHAVLAFHRATSSLAGLEGLPVERVTGDLTDPASLKAAMPGVEAVFHAAALLGERSTPERLQAVTVQGTRAVLEAARQAGVRRFVHTSSVAALGIPGFRPDQLLDEAHTWSGDPSIYPYGWAKYLAELEVQKAVWQGLEAVIVNPSLIFGAGDVYRARSSAIVEAARGHLPVSMPGGLNVVHIDDVVAGHLAALEKGRPGERYILGGENLTFSRLLQIAAEVTGGPAPVAVLPAGLVRSLAGPVRWAQTFFHLPVGSELLTMAGRYFYYSLEKAQTQLGLGEPRCAAQAIEAAWAWFQSHPGG